MRPPIAAEGKKQNAALGAQFEYFPGRLLRGATVHERVLNHPPNRPQCRAHDLRAMRVRPWNFSARNVDFSNPTFRVPLTPLVHLAQLTARARREEAQLAAELAALVAHRPRCTALFSSFVSKMNKTH